MVIPFVVYTEEHLGPAAARPEKLPDPPERAGIRSEKSIGPGISTLAGFPRVAATSRSQVSQPLLIGTP